MWERAAELVTAAGGTVKLHSRVVELHRSGDRITSATLESGGERQTMAVSDVISTMPLPALARTVTPAVSADTLDAASRLRFRDFLIVVLIVNRAELFPDNWLYIHSPAVKVGRIQNFKNWSAAMLPDQSTTSVGMEYFCSADDDVWGRSDADLIAMATSEIDTLGLAPAGAVVDGCVIRQPKAYPVYDDTYRLQVDRIRQGLSGVVNLQTIGRNGMHRYNNQDHSMLTGMLAARNVLGEQHDLWEVNTERSYYEEQQVTQERAG
jgi:protoporphyrinogen oxidase